MHTVAIIICAGKCSRWDNYLGVRKHFVEIEGEKVLFRTVRLLKSHLEDRDLIYVVGIDDSYKLLGTELFVPEEIRGKLSNGIEDRIRCRTNQFLNSRDLWNDTGRTLIVYGDVWFSDESMAKLFGYQEVGWTLFGRNFTPSKPIDPKLSYCYPRAGIKDVRGPFVISFLPSMRNKFEATLEEIEQSFRTNKLKDYCGGFCIYEKMREKYGRCVSWYEINDWTDDFDLPEDYCRWISRRLRYKKKTRKVFL